MTPDILTIKSRNAYGNIGAGICLLGFGAALELGSTALSPLLCAVFLLVVASTSFAACFARNRERADEMSTAHDGQAASFALKTTLIALGIACCIGIPTGMKVELVPACCLALGFGLTLYGCSFAWLERG